MSEHTLLTIHYFESLYSLGKEAASTKTRADWLFTQIKFWERHFGPPWTAIMTEHTQLAAEAGEAVRLGKDPSALIASLFTNMKRVAAHLKRHYYSPDTVTRHWTNHLNCTVDYLTALKEHGSASPRFQAAKQQCITYAHQFGRYLDGVSDSTPDIDF